MAVKTISFQHLKKLLTISSKSRSLVEKFPFLFGYLEIKTYNQKIHCAQTRYMTCSYLQIHTCTLIRDSNNFSQTRLIKNTTGNFCDKSRFSSAYTVYRTALLPKVECDFKRKCFATSIHLENDITTEISKASNNELNTEDVTCKVKDLLERSPSQSNQESDGVIDIRESHGNSHDATAGTNFTEELEKSVMKYEISDNLQGLDVSSDNAEDENLITDKEDEIGFVKNKDVDLDIQIPKGDHSYQNFGPLVEKSEVLSCLLILGVNLWKIQKQGQADLLLRLNLQRDVIPLLHVLHNAGFEDSDLATVISKYPLIFEEDVDDVEVRLNYLSSKKFSPVDIVRIVTTLPEILSTPTVETDRALGFYQQLLKLSGNKLRCAVVRYPQLIMFDQDIFKNNCLIMKNALDFQTEEIKDIFVQIPQILYLDMTVVGERMKFLLGVLGFDYKRITTFPQLLTIDSSFIKIRHQFLKSLGRDQYDPKKPNYVPGIALCTMTEEEFLETVAKSNKQTYSDFLKTI